MRALTLLRALTSIWLEKTNKQNAKGAEGNVSQFFCGRNKVKRNFFQRFTV